MSEDKTLEQCVWHEIAVSQRQHEIKMGQGLEGTKNYEICYKCDGKNYKCLAYKGGNYGYKQT